MEYQGGSAGLTHGHGMGRGRGRGGTGDFGAFGVTEDGHGAGGGGGGVENRKLGVLGKLRQFLSRLKGKDFQNLDVNKKGTRSTGGGGKGAFGTSGGGGGDDGRTHSESKGVHYVGLEDIERKILKTTDDVHKFNGPHFTSEYRILLEDCSKHSLALDNYDCVRMDGVRKERKRLLLLCQQIESDLKAKTHPDGRPCPECEIKNL